MPEKTFNILCPVGCRSDRGLVEPIIRRLRQDPAFEVLQYDLKPMDFIESYRITVDKINEFHPSLFFSNADRVEMTGATAAAFHNKIKIAHYQAGVINDPITTFDDVDRHVITLWSDIQFCENQAAANTIWMEDEGYDGWYERGLFAGIKEPNIHIVGITHLDDLEVDESKVPVKPVDILNKKYPVMKIPYDLILINNEPLNDVAFSFEKKRHTIQIGGNPDGTVWRAYLDGGYYPNLPRPQFLGLLKNCQRFITNSSCAITEAPYFLKPEQIVMVGDRNRNRPPVECKPGGSDKIVAILKEYAEKLEYSNNQTLI
jgi:UDP-N-acetylglucosamine 2-epimerase